MTITPPEKIRPPDTYSRPRPSSPPLHILFVSPRPRVLPAAGRSIAPVQIVEQAPGGRPKTGKHWGAVFYWGSPMRRSPPNAPIVVEGLEKLWAIFVRRLEPQVPDWAPAPSSSPPPMAVPPNPCRPESLPAAHLLYLDCDLPDWCHQGGSEAERHFFARGVIRSLLHRAHAHHPMWCGGMWPAGPLPPGAVSACVETLFAAARVYRGRGSEPAWPIPPRPHTLFRPTTKRSPIVALCFSSPCFPHIYLGPRNDGHPSANVHSNRPEGG